MGSLPLSSVHICIRHERQMAFIASTPFGEFLVEQAEGDFWQVDRQCSEATFRITSFRCSTNNGDSLTHYKHPKREAEMDTMALNESLVTKDRGMTVSIKIACVGA